MLNLGKKGGTGACVRCEEAGTRPSARVGLAMSVFTHGVNKKGKPRMINRNQVFPVRERIKALSRGLAFVVGLGIYFGFVILIDGDGLPPVRDRLRLSPFRSQCIRRPCGSNLAGRWDDDDCACATDGLRAAASIVIAESAKTGGSTVFAAQHSRILWVQVRSCLPSGFPCIVRVTSSI